MNRSRARRDLTPALDPVLDFLRLLWSIEHGLQRSSKSMHATLGVTGPQRLVLVVVSRNPGISPGAVAEFVRLHPSTITGILQRLERKKLLVRTRNPADSRRVHLYALKPARSLARRAPGTVEAAVAGALRQVRSADARAARAVLARIVAALEDETT